MSYTLCEYTHNMINPVKNYTLPSRKANFALSDVLFAKITVFYLDQGEGFLENVTLNRDQWKRSVKN